MWDSVGYELDWPPELLRSELLALLNHPYRAWTGSEIELLLREAFHTAAPASEFTRLNSLGEWIDDPGPTRAWLTDLLEHRHELRPYTPPLPYWAVRQKVPAPASIPTDPAGTPRRFAGFIEQLHNNGYLARDFGEPCVDDHTEWQPGPALNTELQQRLGVPSDRHLWPLKPHTWDADTFYSLIEVFHDLIARPRTRGDHEFNQCGWHFQDFDIDAGRRIYRTLVNRLLESAGIELRLAEDGEDVGRLVQLVDEARVGLVEHALATPDPEVTGRVAHAIALFRRRNATEHEKRSAIVTLALVLEERRSLLKTTLFRGDEGALFRIANEFDLRHRDDKQHTDYDPAFRDWVFWWYLATIELTDRLLARQDSLGSSPTKRTA